MQRFLSFAKPSHSTDDAILINRAALAWAMLGRITGKVTTLQFSFELLPGTDVRKFEYIKVHHRVYDWVLCQVVEIEASHERTLCRCNVLGYKEKGKVQQIRIPFDVESEVFLADNEFIRAVIQLDGGEEGQVGAYLGKLDGKEIDVRLDLGKLLTKHVAVLAKSGAGKSYAVGVLIEEIMERKVPVLVIDPHGEYGKIGERNAEKADREAMVRFGIKPKAYAVREYGDPNSPGLTPLRLPNNLTQQELVQLIPGKLNNTQLGILYSAIKGLEQLNFDTLLLSLEAEESSAKWSIINLVEHLRDLGIFSSNPIAYNELVKSGLCSVINMRGIAPEIQQIIVYKVAKDLFELRKVNKVPPFFLVVEEAHNYCPERSFGEATSSKVLRTIASEGRKFGLGLCIISQRPARVDKSVLSQCTTQLILKVTNPNDLKAISASVEGLTSESEAEIQNLSIGTALVTGVVDMPLFVNIRPRRTRHGGHAVNMLDQPEQGFLQQRQKFEEQALLPLIKPRTTLRDRQVMSPAKVKSARTVLIPGYLFACKEREMQYNLLVDMTNGEVVVDLEDYTTAKLPETEKLTPSQVKLLKAAHVLKRSAKEQLVAKAATGLDVDDDLQDLVAKGYISYDKERREYAVTRNYILTKLSKHACFYPVQYEPIQYSTKLPPATNLDAVKGRLARFTAVLDQQECAIVTYELETQKE